MKRNHMKLAAVPFACLAITLAACGGGGGGDSTSTSAAAGPGTSTATTPTAPTSPAAPAPAAATSSAMLSGTTDPGPGIGKDGDYYLNTVTWMMFGPKANGVWPAGVSLAGPGGNTGAAGNTILSGSVDPTASVGNNGDYYINTSTSTLFGPKANGTWPAGVPLGSGTGSPPPSGGTVLSGTGVPDNSLGNNGDYYLDTSTWTLYGPKANGVWPAGVTLVSQSGGSGGTSGTGGTGGTTVGNGGHVLYGTGAPTDDIGVNGDFYFDTTTWTMYGPKQDGKWPTSGVTMANGTVYNGNFNVPDSLSRGRYAMTGAGGAVALPSDFGVVIPYDCTRVTLTASTLGKVQGTLDISVHKVTGSGASVTLTPVKDLSCKVTNGQQTCSQEVTAGTITHGDKLQVQVDNNQATDWGGLTVNLACIK